MEFFIPRIIQSCIIIPGKNCEHLSCSCLSSMILPLFLAVPRNVSSLLRVLVQVSVQKNINEAWQLSSSSVRFCALGITLGYIPS